LEESIDDSKAIIREDSQRIREILDKEFAG
jgi:hypothetical protein